MVQVLIQHNKNIGQGLPNKAIQLRPHLVRMVQFLADIAYKPT